MYLSPRPQYLRLLSVLMYCLLLIVDPIVCGDFVCGPSIVILLVLQSYSIVTLIVGVCNCSMFCCSLLYVHSSFAINVLGKRELVGLLSLYSWCPVIVVLLFLVQ